MIYSISFATNIDPDSVLPNPKKPCPTSYSNTEDGGRLVFVADPFLDFEEPCQPTNIDLDSVLPKKP
ncbi:MAG TPA: hypothetical protein VFY68_10175 [Nitrososphaeraceae archaeon]|nr:hypothetical protein [Nitrososphaeraceae archaeon]